MYYLVKNGIMKISYLLTDLRTNDTLSKRVSVLMRGTKFLALLRSVTKIKVKTLKKLLKELKNAQYNIKVLEQEIEDVSFGKNSKIALLVLNDKDINNEIKTIFQSSSELRIIRLNKNQLTTLKELI